MLKISLLLRSAVTIRVVNISDVGCGVRTCSTAPKQRLKSRASQSKAQKFSDYRRLFVRGGNGGNGRISFLSIFQKEWAGPDGGDGGNGGHAIFIADNNTKDLSSLQSLIKAKDGERGSNKCMHGKSAEHSYLKVPRGTVVRDSDDEILCDLSNYGDTFLASRGGGGGRGNHYFLSNENRAPTIAEEGGLGEQRYLHLELKVMAHAGLVGFPNAGKSTLLQAISRARPKIAPYPFTTLHPSIGIVEYTDHVQVAVADLPGLVEGAHKNYGLGAGFLRHIERCLCLFYVIDLSVHEPWWQLEALKYELEQYQPGLSTRPHAVVANKLDLPDSEARLKELEARLSIPIFAVSAKYGKHVDALLVHLRTLHDKYKDDDT